MKYLIIIEKDGKGCSAYVPDLPGCVAAGDTEEEVRELIQRRASSYISRACERLEIPFRNLRAPPSTSKLLHDLALS